MVKFFRRLATLVTNRFTVKGRPNWSELKDPKALSSLGGDCKQPMAVGLRSKLIIIFLLVKVIPLILLAAIAWRQFTIQGHVLQDIAVTDSSQALNNSAVENIERMSTDAAQRVADFLYARDADILYVASLPQEPEAYEAYVDTKVGRRVKKGRWVLSPDGQAWVPAEVPARGQPAASTNIENNDMDGFNPRLPDDFNFELIPLYDEITFVDLGGQEIIKAVAKNSPKIHYPLDPAKKDVSRRENTYVKAETYFEELKKLKPGEIYVSDVIGAYVGTNYIGLYTPSKVSAAEAERGYGIPYKPEDQAFAGRENPVGQRFEGLVRWATPVTDRGQIIGYVTMALNHDHIMAFVDNITPMNERYVELPSAYEGNYAFIWDYQCRNVAHPRHHSIVGFDPATGQPQVPWLESSIYEGWQASGLAKWTEFIKDYPLFNEQSRSKKPAGPLTRQGLVGLDGRYLNFAPQCTGWMDLTADGGSGSFYILWSGLYKLNTAAAIPYYTGRYAPSEANGYSRRGFGFIAIGSELDSFTAPARETGLKLTQAIKDNLSGTFIQLTSTTIVLIIIVVIIAIWMASSLTGNITRLIKGVSRYRNGERQFRFHPPVKDEFGTLADSFDDMADSIAHSVTSPLTITDMDQRIIYMNEYGLKIRKKSLDDVVGHNYGENSIYPQGSKYDPILALEEGRESDIYFVEDQNLYLKGVANYFLSADGRKIGYIIETTNMTEMVIKQLELEKAMHEARRANEHKGDFLARMSHEIRTPMNAIIGLTNIVQNSLSDANCGDTLNVEEIEGHVRQIETSSQHLLGLLNDVLDLSKIDAGKISLALEAVDLPQVVETVASIIKPRCEEKNIEFLINLDHFSPSVYKTDSLRLRQVLINLLGNAVKFTPEAGRVEFNIANLGRMDEKTLVKFKICDTGIGIEPDRLENIFKPFEQATGQITRKYGGTGLGLSISRHIVQMLGSDIEVKSRVGEGSEFSFAIWLCEAPEGERPKIEAAVESPANFAGRRVLLVDDVSLNRKVARAMLKRIGLSIDEAEDGLMAVRAFEESPENTYDLILMDVQMPTMDGFEASRAIRAMNRADAKRVPIVALTANAFQEDVEKALKAGMNGHVAKPVRMDTLADVLGKFLGP